MYVYRADSKLAPSQWEMLLLCNNVSHWLGTILESALCMYIRADSRFASSQWETVLLCNNVSHRLGANLKSALYMVVLRNWPQPVLLRWMCCLVFFVILLSSWVVCLPWFRVTMVAVELHTDWPGWRQPRCRRWHTMATWWCTDRNIADDTMKMYTVGCWYNMLLSGPICYSFSLEEKKSVETPKVFFLGEIYVMSSVNNNYDHPVYLSPIFAHSGTSMEFCVKFSRFHQENAFKDVVGKLAVILFWPLGTKWLQLCRWFRHG